ncbi:hypothetical protein C9374_010280 [Naegleria lovaniensis]|uniref:Uncharacterized protein n=1 Tax=Naegleria lovaniensis TaxID=51637 RepID=A0AA88GE70_NAELO|nr:uncharacterized protein C9374_010280 [Naegleria lovaniensis]KAG2374906.1 hypothetical protein C9374_010280 [Naegleria lovaniensis]
MRDLWVNDKKPLIEVDYEELVRKRTQPTVVLQTQVALKNVFDGLLLRRREEQESEEELKFTRMIGILRIDFEKPAHQRYYRLLQEAYAIIRREFSSRALSIIEVPADYVKLLREPFQCKETKSPFYQVLSSGPNVKLLIDILKNIGFEDKDEDEPSLILLHCWKANAKEHIVSCRGPRLEELEALDCLQNANSQTMIGPVLSMFQEWRTVLGDRVESKKIEGTIEDQTEHNIKMLFKTPTLVTRDKKEYDTLEILQNKPIIGLVFAPSWCVGVKLQKQQEYIEKVVNFHYETKQTYGLDSFEMIMVDGEQNEGRLYDYMKKKQIGFLAVPFKSVKAKLSLSNIFNPKNSVPRTYIVNLRKGIVLDEFIHQHNVDILEDCSIYMEWLKDLQGF